MSYSSTSVFCDQIGSSSKLESRCCRLDDQTGTLCQDIFNPKSPTFADFKSGDYVTDCQNNSLLYHSLEQNNFLEGNGKAPIQRFQTCANVPAMASYLKQDILEPSINSSVARYVFNAAGDDLSKVTLAVTDCLTSTCKHSRNVTACKTQCSSVRLLINNTTPNMYGLDQCLNTLCTGQYDSLPYADADVVGIGVFASYIMQCIFIALFWFGFLAFEIHKRPKQTEEKPEAPEYELAQSAPEPQPLQVKLSQTEEELKAELKRTREKLKAEKQKNARSTTRPKTHQEAFENFLVQFHNTQCYFSATIQIASLCYRIFEVDLLVTFMLIPLATNGVLPVVFVYLLLFYYKRASRGATLLTIICWTLSSIVYWILYAHVAPIDSSQQSESQAYQQFYYKLSAIPACGGYSALAVCPDEFKIGKRDIRRATRRIWVLTPMIWAFSTICLVTLMRAKVAAIWRRKPQASQRCICDQPDTQNHYPFSRFWLATYWLTTVCFLAGIGMQISLLTIATSLKMMDRKNWTFGQIVAVTIWAPPLFEFLCNEIVIFHVRPSV